MTSTEDKIRKLLRLAAQQDNENEAANAWAAAQKLATQHELNLDDILNEAPENTEIKHVVDAQEIILETTGRYLAWKGYIAAAVAKSNLCGVYHKRASYTDRVFHVVAYGQPDDLERVKELYNSIVYQCDEIAKRATEKYKNDPDLDPRFDDSPRMFSRNFRMGFAAKIAQRLPSPEKVVEETRAELPDQLPQTAITKIDNALVYISSAKEALDKKSRSLNLRKRQGAKFSGRGSGYAEGMRAGESASITSSRSFLKGK